MLPADAASRYQAWLVDLDGTLYRPMPVKLAMAAELLLFGWGSIATLRTFRQAHEELRQLSQGATLETTPFERQLELAARKLGSETTVVERHVNEWMFERPLKWVARAKRQGLLTALADYRASGGKTALVSDYPATAKLRALDAHTLFDTVVSNGEPGGPRRLKPDPEGYLAAAERLGIAPQHCLVIGDRDDADGQAARNAGMAVAIIH
ncbi:MAG TPA: HAD family hydrolase [Polyangiaceae bacterium]|nr:HAD family hydrolase [Polyangiaceae bacterium]